MLIEISKKWGDKPVFDKFSLSVKDGAITALLGKSGVGKTTLLNAVARLIDFEGSVEDAGGVSYVFQEHRLIPFMTVRQNLEYVLSDAVGDKNEVNRLIEGVLTAVRLTECAKKVVDRLSGGEKQRVSLARALVYPSKVVLMDEPFNSLDLGLKISLMTEYRQHFADYGKTCIFVTHSVDEALYFADDVYFLKPNEAVFIGSVAGERAYGYEKSGAMRKTLYSLLTE